MNPLVSLVVPCYKLAHLLPECIESILGQTYGDFEVLIMDDCLQAPAGRYGATERPIVAIK